MARYYAEGLIQSARGALTNGDIGRAEELLGKAVRALKDAEQVDYEDESERLAGYLCEARGLIKEHAAWLHERILRDPRWERTRPS